MPIHFEKCRTYDLEKLVEISRETFVNAFEKDNDPDDFKAYVALAFGKQVIEQQLLAVDSSFYFVFKDTVLAGYFKLNENAAQTDIKATQAIELERIYVLQGFQGQQIGKEILLEAIRLASKKEKAFIWLGVWEKNTAAIRFYTKHGFVKFGTHPYYIGKDKQTDWLMRYEI